MNTDDGRREIVVHGEVVRECAAHEAYDLAQSERRKNPNRHVAVRDSSGISTPVEYLDLGKELSDID